MALYTGNRLEDLADALAAVLRRPVPDPLAEETLIVQSRGMERWISLALADRLGICANVAFPFPNAFLDKVLTAVYPDISDAALVDRDTLAFRMMAPLSDASFTRSAPELAAYLVGDDDDTLKAYRLARHLADRFDQYAVFRPDMVREWISGAARHWQARLWRQVFGGASADHRAGRLSRLLGDLSVGSLDPTGALPHRLCLFGISYLPPLYTDVFHALAGVCEVHLFLLNPCREYWAHIQPQRRIQRTIATAPSVGEPIDQWLHLESGNRLLASWGRLGQEYFGRLCGMDDLVIADVFTSPGEDTVLHRLQTDILALTESDPLPGGDGKYPVDESVQVHACHSPMREVEVLHDHVLHFLDTRSDLTPSDILVMTPDIDTYAPLVEAVFGSRDSAGQRFPYHTADRGGARHRPAVQAFLHLLSLRRRRITVSEVDAFVSYPFVRAAWEVTDADLDEIRRWIQHTAIRWGIDLQHRDRLGMPATDANSWRQGIRRLLLGYAMGDAPEGMLDEVFETPAGDILPYTPVEGSDALRFGRFVDLLETLFATVIDLDRARSLTAWADDLQPLVDRFFAVDHVPPEDRQFLTRHIHRLAELAAASAFHREVDIALIAAWLTDACDADRSSGGFLTGGVTVCAMLPMRSIPAKVICLLGMNTDGFPRRDPQSGIDLMARSPLPGDRSARNDDRYLFLEALASARDVFYISYIGQNVADNAPMPPSVLVSELVDYLNQCLGVAESELIRHHPLQPFSDRYFAGTGPLFSYAAENCVAPATGTGISPLLSAPLPEPPEALLQLNVDDLCRFFKHPAQYLANRRLGMAVPSLDDAVEDREPFALNGLDRWVMGNDLLQATMSGASAAERRKAHLASGILPPGTSGEAVYDRLRRDVRILHRRIRSHCNAPLESMSVALTIDGVEIDGAIDGVTRQDRLEYRFGKLRPVDRVSSWIRHLVWQAAFGDSDKAMTRTVAEDATLAYRPVNDPEALLTGLLKLFRAGLREPLPFLPDPSYTYAAQLQKNGRSDPKELRRELAAKDLVAFANGRTSVAGDPYVSLYWPRGKFFDAAFGEASLAVIAPMMAHLTQ